MASLSTSQLASYVAIVDNAQVFYDVARTLKAIRLTVAAITDII